MRERARTVVIGAGIVGASAAYHLAELGERDVLVLDQGPLFETGGSSSHAPGLAFQTNGSRMMCRIAQESVALYTTLGRRRRTRLVRRRRDRGRDHRGADAGAEAAARVRALVRARGGRAADARRDHREDPAPRSLHDPRGVPRALGRHRQGRDDRDGARAPRRGERRGVRGRRDRDRVRRPRRARARRPDGPGRRRVRTRPALRRDLGAHRRCDGWGSDPARRGAAPARLDRADRRPRRRDAGGRAPDPPSPGHGDVLPPPEGPLRGRELQARADRDAADRVPAAR